MFQATTQRQGDHRRRYRHGHLPDRPGERRHAAEREGHNKRPSAPGRPTTRPTEEDDESMVKALADDLLTDVMRDENDSHTILRNEGAAVTGPASASQSADDGARLVAHVPIPRKGH